MRCEFTKKRADGLIFEQKMLHYKVKNETLRLLLFHSREAFPPEQKKHGPVPPAEPDPGLIDPYGAMAEKSGKCPDRRV